MGNYFRKEKKTVMYTDKQQYRNNDIRFISKRDSIITKNDVIMLKPKKRQYPNKYSSLKISRAVILIEPNTHRNPSHESYNNINVPESPTSCKTSNYKYEKYRHKKYSEP